MGIQQSITLTFQDASGTPIANGRVVIWLTYDLSSNQANGIQVAAGRKLNVPLDDQGSCFVTLFINGSLQPAGSKYNAKAYTSVGQPCWEGSFTVVSTGENFLLQEDGDAFTLEDGSGLILLET